MAETNLADRRILVVEDEYLLAETLADFLAAAGADVIGPAASVEASLSLLDSGRKPDAALLDVNLGGEEVYPVADRLSELQVPFVFMTGYDKSSMPDKYHHMGYCKKPYTASSIHAALSAVFPRKD